MRGFLLRFGRLPLVPFAIAFLVCVPIWVANQSTISYEMVVPITLALLAATAILLGAIWLGVRDWARASLIAAIWNDYLLTYPRWSAPLRKASG